MAALCAIDQIVPPADVLDLPAEFPAWKQKVLVAARKRARLLAIETLGRRAQALADEASDADNDDAGI